MRVLLADDQPEIRSALRLLLEQADGIAVVGEANKAGDLLAQLEAARPDVLLLDWELPSLRPSETVPVMRARYPHLCVIALSSRPERSRQALAAGADAFVCKCDAPEVLLAAMAESAR
jgi:DNA-binding NarL/FixJ family response regulator